MGNCQAVDNATLVIQHPNGKVDKRFTPVIASEIMKINPGHYVALLLTTTLYSSTAAAAAAAAGATVVPTTKDVSGAVNKSTPLRVTRIKLLRPTDSLLLGHAYRLVTAQEVLKGLGAKKLAKVMQRLPVVAEVDGKFTEKQRSNFEAIERTKQLNNGRHNKSRNTSSVNSSAAAKCKTWQPSLNSISEAGS